MLLPALQFIMLIADYAIFGQRILHGVLTYSGLAVCCLLAFFSLLTFSALGHPYYYGYEDALWLMMYNRENGIFCLLVIFFSWSSSRGTEIPLLFLFMVHGLLQEQKPCLIMRG